MKASSGAPLMMFWNNSSNVPLAASAGLKSLTASRTRWWPLLNVSAWTSTVPEAVWAVWTKPRCGTVVTATAAVCRCERVAAMAGPPDATAMPAATSVMPATAVSRQNRGNGYSPSFTTFTFLSTRKHEFRDPSGRYAPGLHGDSAEGDKAVTDSRYPMEGLTSDHKVERMLVLLIMIFNSLQVLLRTPPFT